MEHTITIWETELCPLCKVVFTYDRLMDTEYKEIVIQPHVIQHSKHGTTCLHSQTSTSNPQNLLTVLQDCIGT
jgi:hypothetical protein